MTQKTAASVKKISLRSWKLNLIKVSEFKFLWCKSKRSVWRNFGLHGLCFGNLSGSKSLKNSKWAFSRKFSQESVLLYLWFLAFLSILCFFALCAVQVCFVDRDSILFFAKRAIFSHYGKWESPKKYLFFWRNKEISYQQGICKGYTSVKNR